MQAIVAADQCWGIGKGGKQPFHIPEDTAFFREQTTGKVVVMGRKTLLALPGAAPLPGRTNVVLTHSGAGLPAGCILATRQTLPEVLTPFGLDNVFIIGGGTVYGTLLPYCSAALVTRVYADYAADTFFPNLDEEAGWKITQKSPIKYHKNICYQFFTYENACPQGLA